MVIRATLQFYRLRKSKKVLRRLDQLYRRKENHLEPHAKEKILSHLSHLQSAILEKNPSLAKERSRELVELARVFMRKGPFERVRDFTVSMGIALAFAIVIRQMWFELFTIPTGSMRPTLKESDLLLVSKTSFGLNIPLTPAHFYFDPSLVNRGAITVFTCQNMDVEDSDTVYFYLFPGKKLFVKRLIGKPGDSLYFYGGKIYGVDRHGNEITDFKASCFDSLEHIPFIHFDGKVGVSHAQGGRVFRAAQFRQMNQEVASLSATPFGFVEGEMGREYPFADYSDLWGFKNYAMARLLTMEQCQELYPSLAKDLEKGIAYLELTHHPSLKEGRVVHDEHNRVRPDVGKSVSVLPLSQEHIDRIADHMTTCRFTVKNGVASRLGFDLHDPAYAKFFPKMEGVPNGTYEIQNGKVSRIYWGGFAKEVSSDHPLYKRSVERILSLYNLGIEFLTEYSPGKKSRVVPSRYAYFREGDLYLLGHPIVNRDDVNLVSFLKKEKDREAISTSVRPYFAFKDQGAPITSEGKLDIEFIRKYGVKVPEKMYMMLGDNHAMSADSRQFGFVPQENLKGTVRILFSPIGERWGSLPQSAQSFFTFPNLFVWTIAALSGGAYILYRRRRSKLF